MAVKPIKQHRFEACFFGDIIQCIVDSPESKPLMLEGTWKDLAITLQTENQILKNILRRSYDETCELQDILEIILLEWHSRLEPNATVRQLVNTLKQDFAELSSYINEKLHSKLDLPVTISQKPQLYAYAICNVNENERLLHKSLSRIDSDCRSQAVHNHWTNIQLLLAVFIALMLALVLVMGLFLYRYILTTNITTPYESARLTSESNFNNSANMDDSARMEQNITSVIEHKDGISQNTTLTLTGATFTDTNYAIYNVSNSMEFNDAIAVLQAHQANKVNIIVSDLKTWNASALMHTDKEIQELIIAGQFNLYLLQHIINAVTNIVTLHIIFANNLGCPDKSDIKYFETALNKLKILKLKNFRQCTEIFPLLQEGYYFSDLNELDIEGANLTTVGTEKLNALLKRVRHTITKLRFRQGTLDSSVLFGMSNIFYRLQELQIELTGSLIRNTYPLGLAQNFPSVQILILRNRCISVGDFTKILELGQLRELEICIVIPPNESFDRHILDKAPLSLQNARINLRFRSPEICTFVSCNQRKAIFQVSTNCNKINRSKKCP